MSKIESSLSTEVNDEMLIECDLLELEELELLDELELLEELDELSYELLELELDELLLSSL